MSLKIVFNGKQYDSVDAMPPDVRKDYEVALESLRKSGGEEILSLLQRGGKHVEAVAGRAQPLGHTEEGGSGGRGLWRVAFWIALGAVAAWWLLRRG